MIFEDRNTLEKWLKQNGWFEEGFVSRIESEGNTIKIAIGFQLAGNYAAGEPRTLKEFEISPKGIKSWTFSESKFKPGYEWCIDGIVLSNEGVGLKFETSDSFEIICDKIEISNPKIIETFTKPWISKVDFFASLENEIIPAPKYWIDSFKQNSLNVGFRVYGEKIKAFEQVPYPDYSGYFIQRIDRVEKNEKGIFIKSVTKRNDTIDFAFELGDEALKMEWKVLQKIISDWEKIKINCGNVTFQGKEWKDYIENDKLPEELEKLKNVW